MFTRSKSNRNQSKESKESNRIDSKLLLSRAKETVKRALPFQKSFTRKKRSPSLSSISPTTPFKKPRISSYDKTSAILQKRCPNPTKCITLGTLEKLIRFHFSHFRVLSQVDISQIQLIGEESANGFVLKLPFHRNGYTANTILKSTLFHNSDNLMYEYKVGIDFINPKSKIYPCFTETYFLGKYKSPEMYDLIKSRYIHKRSARNKPIIPELSEVIEPIPIDWAVGCEHSQHLCLLIQYFDDVVPLQKLRNKHPAFSPHIFPALSSIFYQVFFVLDQLKDVYTHYDFHAGNVLMYKPFPGNVYMQMHYHNVETGKVISFPADRIAKIIDYGLNHFRTETETSEQIIEQICQTPECGPFCGTERGFRFIKGKQGLASDQIGLSPQIPDLNDPYNGYRAYFIDPTVKNNSHDLRILYDFEFYTNHHSIQLPTVSNQTEFGFPESKDTFLGDSAIPMISTVTDMCRFLEHTANEWTQNLPYTSSWECGGDLHVYSDGRPYTFLERK